MKFDLRLRFDPDARPEPGGWFLPGSDPQPWLQEMAGWGIPLIGLRMWPVPSSRRDRRVCGMFVPVPAGALPRTSPWAQAYRSRGRRLWIPVQARVEPDLLDAEIDEALSGMGECFLLHPAAGLVAFEIDDGLFLHQVLGRPDRREGGWDVARCGVAGAPRLRSVEPEEPPTLESIMRESRDDIGREPPKSLPPLPEEQGKPAREPGAGWARRQLARALLWATENAPPTAPAPTWVDRVRDWARRQLKGSPFDRNEARHRELQRLLRMLATDPDRGLKFAVPLAGAKGRGLAPPGDRLGPRNVDFNLDRLGGGQAGDPWNVPWEMHQALRQHYHEAANRELRLGRHRRAAYIFAELLGNPVAAAAALVQGRHFREAAILYRDHLNRPLEAAQCLEQGGLLAEAVVLYESTGHFESAGDLLCRMDRQPEAVVAWRRAAEKHADTGDLLAACRLLERKVNAPEEALGLLASAWPWSEHAGPALRERFAILGRMARHEDARRLLLHLRGEAAPPSRSVVLVQVLAAVAAAYPDSDVRARAADSARVSAGRHLHQANLAETEEIVQAIARLAPEDRLLARDGARFVARRRVQLTTPERPASPGGDPVLLGTFQLPRDVTWQAAASQGRVFYAAGVGEGVFVVVRGLWDGTLQRLEWKQHVPAHARILLQPGTISTHPTLVAVAAGPRLEYLRFGGTGSLPVATRVGTPDGLPDRVLALSYGEYSTVWVVSDEGGALVLSARTLEGAIVSTHALPVAPEGEGDRTSAETAWPILMTRRDSVYVATGNRVIALVRGESFVVTELHDPVLEIAGSDPLSRPRLAATFEWGGAVLWGGLDWGNVRVFGERLWRPLATWTRDGSLVAVAQGEGQIYGTENFAISHRRTFPCPEIVPFAVVPAAGLSEFALFGADGSVRLYRVQGG